MHAFVFVLLLVLIAALPSAWVGAGSWLDVELAAGFYLATGLAIAVGFHRRFTCAFRER